MATPPKGPVGSEFEVPDLDLAPSLPATPARRVSGTTRAVARPESPDPFGDGLELSPSAAVPLELSTGGSPGGPAPAAATMDQYMGNGFEAGPGGALDLDTDAALPLQPVAAVDDTPWPSGLTPARSELSINPAVVTRTAAYGPPGSVVLAPLYAYRVFMRQRELKEHLAAAERSLEEAELERAQLLKEMVQSRRATIEANERFGRLLDPLAALEAEAKERQHALTQVHGELSGQVSSYDAKLADLEARRLEQQKVVLARETQHATVEENYGRASAKLKRVQIEIRNIEARVRELVGPEGGVVPPEMARQLKPLKEQLRALEPNAKSAQEALEASRAQLSAAEAEVTQTTRAMAHVEKEKRALMSKYEGRIASTSADLRQAETLEREAFLAVARAILDLRGTLPVDVDTRRRILLADQLVERRVIEHEVALRALEDFDHERRSLGHKLALGVGGFLLLLVLLAVVF